MYIGFISYNSGEHYLWLCKDWGEMYEYCKNDIEVEIPFKVPNDIEDKNYFAFINSIVCEDCVNNDGDDSWISIGLASEYSLDQINKFKYGR